MDSTAFTMCRENNMPMVVFDMNKAGNLAKLIDGETIGTIVLQGSEWVLLFRPILLFLLLFQRFY